MELLGYMAVLQYDYFQQGYTWKCSGLTHDSVLRDHSWRCSGDSTQCSGLNLGQSMQGKLLIHSTISLAMFIFFQKLLCCLITVGPHFIWFT